MPPLELKIPPPVVAVLTAAAMRSLSSLTARTQVPVAVRASASLVVAIMGVGIAIAGVVVRRAHTTVSPLKPEAASHLVTSGIYRFTSSYQRGVPVTFDGYAT